MPTISDLARNADGHWCARLTINGRTFAVDRSQGSWRYTPTSDTGYWQEVAPAYAEALQARVRTLQRIERRQAQTT